METLNSALDDFLLEQEARLNSEKTIRDYSEKITLWINFVGDNRPLESISTNEIREWIADLRERDLARETIRSYITALFCGSGCCGFKSRHSPSLRGI